MTTIIRGGDVAPDHLDARLRPETALRRRFGDSAEGAGGHRRGGCGELPLGLLWAVAIPAAVANPPAARRFAEATGAPEERRQAEGGHPRGCRPRAAHAPGRRGV